MKIHQLNADKIHQLNTDKIRFRTNKIAERSSYESRQTPQPPIFTAVSNICDVAIFEIVHSYFRFALIVFFHGVTIVTKHITERIVFVFTFSVLYSCHKESR